MKSYDAIVFQKLAELVKANESAGLWLKENGCQELVEFMDAIDGMEKSFKWLLENNQRPLAATVDALSGNDKAKAWLIASGRRELAAFTDASSGSQTAISWLHKNNYSGWVIVARELFLKNQKKEKSIWNFLDFGNPFR